MCIYFIVRTLIAWPNNWVSYSGLVWKHRAPAPRLQQTRTCLHTKSLQPESTGFPIMSGLTRLPSVHPGDMSTLIVPLLLAGKAWIFVPCQTKRPGLLRSGEHLPLSSSCVLVKVGDCEGHSHFTSLAGETWFMMRSSGAWGQRNLRAGGPMNLIYSWGWRCLSSMGRTILSPVDP